MAHHLFEHLDVALGVVALAEGEAGADQRVAHAGALGDAQAAVVQESATALGGVEQIVARRVVDDGLLHHATVCQRDRHAVHGEAVDEVGRAVQRVDDPDIFGMLGAMRAARLFGEDAVVGIGLEKRFDDGFFSHLVHLGHEVIGRLGVDLQDVEVHRCAIDDRASSAGRLDGDVEHRMVSGLQRHARIPAT